MKNKSLKEQARELQEAVELSDNPLGGKYLNPRAWHINDGHDPMWHNVIRAIEERGR